MLQARVFRDEVRLQRCLLNDRDHVTKGDKGSHVRAIQVALTVIDDAVIARDELERDLYGPTTAKAVLAYKKKRSIINRSYQTAPDDIVGKMTIAALDKEAQALEASPLATGRFRCPQNGPGRFVPPDKPPPKGILLAQAERRPSPNQA